MPTPLPAVVEPDYAPTLNAYRTGVQDKFVQDQRNNMKEAGGLAAAGNLKGATSSLYAGGNFDEANKMQEQMRQIQSQARLMANDKLERASKTYELFGRLIPTIQTPEQLETAKGLIKQRTGMDMSHVTMEQLPMLQQENLTIEQHLNNEREKRQAEVQQQQYAVQQANANRAYRANREDAANQQSNANRTYDAGRTDAASLNTYREGELANAKDRIDAALKKGQQPKPLTSEQAKAQAYHIEMNQANNTLKDTLVNKREGGLRTGDKANKFGELGESPLSSASNALAISEYTPGYVNANYLDKKQRQFLQNAEQFLSVLLYHRSGAQISQPEFARSYRIYFPQPGDDLQTRRYKSQARKNAIEGVRIQGAIGADLAPGAPAAPNAGNDWSDIKVLSEE